MLMLDGHWVPLAAMVSTVSAKHASPLLRCRGGGGICTQAGAAHQGHIEEGELLWGEGHPCRGVSPGYLHRGVYPGGALRAKVRHQVPACVSLHTSCCQAFDAWSAIQPTSVPRGESAQIWCAVRRAALVCWTLPDGSRCRNLAKMCLCRNDFLGVLEPYMEQEKKLIMEFLRQHVSAFRTMPRGLVINLALHVQQASAAGSSPSVTELADTICASRLCLVHSARDYGAACAAGKRGRLLHFID